MKTGHIPVLLEIVERGSNAPDENMLQPQSATGAQDEASNEDPTVPRAVHKSHAQQSDLETTNERPVIPEEMIEQMLDDPVERKEILEQAMAIIMPQLEEMARKTIEQLVNKNNHSDKS